MPNNWDSRFVEAGYHLKTDTATAPAYQTPKAAGFDLAAAETVTIQPGEVKLVPTGLVVGLPPAHHLLLFARSSLAKKKGVIVANGVGVVDNDYCGIGDEIRVMLLNTRQEPVTIEVGERIAQGVVMPTIQALFSPFQPEDKSRGGFGSTGGYKQ